MHAHVRNHDLSQAIVYFERACSLESERGCENLANALMSGEDGASDEIRAIALLEQLCHSGRPHGCTLLAEAYLSGHGGAEKRALGPNLLDESCRANDREACQLRGEPGLLDGDVDRMIRDARRRVVSCARGSQPDCAAAATPPPRTEN